MALTISPVRINDADRHVSLRKMPAAPKKGGFSKVANKVHLLAFSGSHTLSVPLWKTLFVRDLQSSKRIEQLIRQIQFGTKKDRIKAIRSAGAMKEKGAVQALGKVARQDKDAELRGWAVVALGMIQDRRAIPTVIDVLKNDPHHENRDRAANILFRFKGKRAVSALMTALKKDRHRKVRFRSAYYLGRLNDHRAVPALMRALGDKDHVVALHADAALMWMGGILLKKGMRKPTASSLLAALKDRNVLARYAAAGLLWRKSKWGKDVEKVLKALHHTALKDKAAAVRSKAIESLGWAKNLESRPVITAALADKETVVRIRAAYAVNYLCRRLMKIPKAVPRLIDVMLNKKGHILARTQALFSLRCMGDRRAVPAFNKLLKDKARGLAKWAAESLGKFNDKRAVKPLIAALLHGNSKVRGKAAESLGNLKDRRAVKPLIARVRDKRENNDVKVDAVYALGSIGGSKAIRALGRMLRSKESFLAECAASALGFTGDKRAVRPLARALKDKRGKVRWNVAFSLGRIRHPQSIKPLIKCLDDVDPNVVDIAVRMLKTRNDKRAKDALRKAGHI